MNPIVSSEWLNINLDSPDLILLEAQLNAPDQEHQIKSARSFNLKQDFCDTTAAFPNTVPSQSQFEENCSALGITNSSTIVVYDHTGVYLSPRVWWLFQLMGHTNVYVLNGGFPDWKQKGFATEKRKENSYTRGSFQSNFKPDKWVDFNFVKANIKEQKALVIDARAAGRFKGTAPEPRKELRSGHIPNSINLPYTTVLENGKYKSTSELEALLQPMVESKKTIVFSCGSGITACIILIAFELIDSNAKAVYDGSWTEWAQRIED